MNRITTKQIQHIIRFFCIVALISTLFACANNDDQSRETDVHCGENGEMISIDVASDDSTAINYSDTFIKTDGQCFVISNMNSFDVELLLIKQDGGASELEETDDFVTTVKAGDKTTIRDVEQDTLYEIACRADVNEGEKVKIRVEAEEY